MSAYVIAELDITDPEKFAEYRGLVPATVEQYGGKYLARGGSVEVLEGYWNPTRIVILEFESTEQAKKWIDSDEYTPVKQIRFESANTNVVLVEGA